MIQALLGAASVYNLLVNIERFYTYKGSYCISKYCIGFKKQMLLAANDLFNPLVAKGHNNACQNLSFPLQIQPVKVSFS